MKKFFAGLIVGLFLATTTFAIGSSGLKLIVNSIDITQDAQPIIIDGRTLVPARALAEQLGAKVEWDAANNAVVITSPEPVVIEKNGEGDRKMSIHEPPIKETSSSVKFTTYKGITAIEVDGEIYYDRREHAEDYLKRNPDAKITSDENQITRTLNGETIIIPVNDENIKAYKGRSYVHIRFYE